MEGGSTKIETDGDKMICGSEKPSKRSQAHSKDFILRVHISCEGALFLKRVDHIFTSVVALKTQAPLIERTVLLF